jgi:hypothetical protein
MYGKDGRSGSLRRAAAERKALARKAKRAGRELCGNDAARYRRVDGVATKLLYQEVSESSDV